MHLMKQEALLTLGTEVRRLRKAADMSQERLAEKLGITREAVSAIERGKTRRPDDVILEGIEVHLGLTRQRAHELMGAVPSIDQDDLLATVLQIAALRDHTERMARWRQLPESMHQAVHQWAQDLLLDAALQVREASGQASRQNHRK
jgi:transcriptional regulator with XRE-family HTH domain